MARPGLASLIDFATASAFSVDLRRMGVFWCQVSECFILYIESHSLPIPRQGKGEGTRRVDRADSTDEHQYP